MNNKTKEKSSEASLVKYMVKVFGVVAVADFLIYKCYKDFMNEMYSEDESEE